MNYPFYIARRLSFSTGGRKATPAVKVAIAAVAISVAVMISAVWIVCGFRNEIMDKVTGFNPDIAVYLADGNEEDGNTILLTTSLEKCLESDPHITETGAALSMPAVFKTAEDFTGVYLKNIPTGRMRDFLAKSIVSGKMPDYSSEKDENKILISQLTANLLGLKAGDRIDTYFITDAVRIRRPEIAGIYSSHFDSYDRIFAFASMPMLQGVQNLKSNRATSIQLSVDKFSNIPRVAESLNSRLISGAADGSLNHLYNVDTVLNTGAGYLNWLQLLDTNVVVIIILMLVVGSITLISGMLIIVLDKKRFIGVMRAIGCPAQKLRSVFILLSMRVTLLGILIGNVVAIVFLYAQYRIHFLHLDADAYYIDFVPVDPDLWWVLAIDLGVIVISYLVLILPSRMIRKISPAETMRDEG